MTNLLAKTAVVYRPANDRFHSRLSWLDSRHTFSFSNHFDPAWTGFGPLLVINDDTIAAGQGFGMHPHRDMEIITVMVDGQINHQDSMGHAEVLRAGEIQRMSAGTGLVHSEINKGDQPCRLLQIWIAPTQQGIQPSYEQRAIAVGSNWTTLLAPQQAEGAMAINRPVHLWRARPQNGEQLTVPKGLGTHLWFQMIDGSLQLEGMDGAPDTLESGDGLGLVHTGDWTLTSRADNTDVLLFSLS